MGGRWYSGKVKEGGRDDSKTRRGVVAFRLGVGSDGEPAVLADSARKSEGAFINHH